MAELLTDSQPSTFEMGDIVFALFKHKWKIIIGAVLGLVAAMMVQSLYTPVYESNAKLLVRYVLERTPIDSDAGSGKTADNAIASELEILTSWDLAMEVAEAMGPKRLLPNSPGASKTDAAGVVSGGLHVGAAPRSSIIFVSYTNADP